MQLPQPWTSGLGFAFGFVKYLAATICSVSLQIGLAMVLLFHFVGDENKNGEARCSPSFGEPSLEAFSWFTGLHSGDLYCCVSNSFSLRFFSRIRHHCHNAQQQHHSGRHKHHSAAPHQRHNLAVEICKAARAASATAPYR
jgi:hypothetical protein